MTAAELRARWRPPEGPVLDIHVHPVSGFGPYGAAGPAEDARRLLESADRAGVTHLALFCLHPSCPREPTPQQCREANDLCLEACDAAPDRLLPFCYLNPAYPDEALAELDRCVAAHLFVGVKLWVAVRASDPRVARIVEAATRHGAPVLQHAWDKVTGNEPGESLPGDVARLARAVPAAKLIMAHLNGHGLRGIERVQACTNLCVDTSGGDPEAGMVELACRRLGYRRVIFGSDAPIRHYGVQMAKVLGADIPERWKRAILWDNAVSLLPGWAKLAGSLA
ncbi:MAG: amidohydrolase family protein [Fimbriimonadaceae bacterium]|nr:amidohydrolase family protein [Fimbriimonadaceae bacterium]